MSRRCECSTTTRCFTPSCENTDQQSTAFACGSDTILRASPETFSCSGAACDEATCCTQPTTDTCSSFNCETDDMLRQAQLQQIVSVLVAMCTRAA